MFASSSMSCLGDKVAFITFLVLQIPILNLLKLRFPVNMTFEPVQEMPRVLSLNMVSAVSLIREPLCKSFIFLLLLQSWF